MLSKILRKSVASSNIGKVGFSSLRKTITELFNPVSPNDPFTKIASFDPLQAVKSSVAVEQKSGTPRYETTKLDNGVTVLTETGIYPNVIDLGILLNVGTRDESLHTSGSLATLKNNYHETLLETSGSKHDLIQNSGGELEMEYDQENTYFKAHCLEHHIGDVFGAMVSAALKPIPTATANVALGKIQQEIDEYLKMGGGDDLNDNIMKTAFGVKGLGMPLGGIKQNILRLTPNTLQKFQRDMIHPENIYVCAAGIDNHNDFVQFVKTQLSFIPTPSTRPLQREPSEYFGGEFINDVGAEEATVALAFKTVSWKEKDIYTFQVLNTLLGSSASFSTGGPGKGMHSRATKNLLNRLSYVDSANALCTCFSDTGLFGLILSGPSTNANELLRSTMDEIKLLADPIPAIELQRAKNITKSNILMALERQKDRLEESVKNIKTFGKLTFHEYCENIDQVTTEHVNTAVARMLLTAPTYVAEGGGLSRLPSYDKLHNMMRL